MAMQYYNATGTPDLIGVSNTNFKSIDDMLTSINSQLSTINSNITSLTNRVALLENTKPVTGESDTALTVQGLNGVKVSKSGFLYYKTA